MQRQIIRLQLDVPIVVKLDSKPEGREKDGKYGVDYEYFVNDDRGVLYLPRDARDQLVRCGAQPGDDVQIVKSMRGRASVFSVQVLPDAQEPAPPPPNNVRQLPPARTTNNAQPEQHRPAAQWMTGALCAAIDASMAAANYAKGRGMELKFNEEDIRSMAATMYIQASKAGRI